MYRWEERMIAQQQATYLLMDKQVQSDNSRTDKFRAPFLLPLFPRFPRMSRSILTSRRGVPGDAQTADREIQRDAGRSSSGGPPLKHSLPRIIVKSWNLIFILCPFREEGAANIDSAVSKPQESIVILLFYFDLAARGVICLICTSRLGLIQAIGVLITD